MIETERSSDRNSTESLTECEFGVVQLVEVMTSFCSIRIANQWIIVTVGSKLF